MNPLNTNDATHVLHALRNQTWPGGEAGLARVERRLLANHASNRASLASRAFAFIKRHRLAAASVIVAAIAGGAIAGSYYFNRLYSITVSDNQGNVLALPRVLVAPGQTASITVGDPNNPADNISVVIDEDGNVISNRDDLNVDVDVQDVEADRPEPPAAQKRPDSQR